MDDTTPTLVLPDARSAQETVERALFEIRRVIAGQDQMLERVLVCLLSGGHLLIEGVPGLAKTLTIKTAAAALGGSFQRIQFTPDLVPSDLVGTRVFRPDTATFDTDVTVADCAASPAIAGAASLARPKSSTLTRPWAVSITFAGLRSRWTIPLSCAATRASATASPNSMTRAIGSPP